MAPPTPAPKLRAPICRVVLDDGTEHEVQAANPDLVRFERTRVKHGWPPASEAPQLWATFVSWHACRRLGVIDPKVTFEQFESTALEAMPVRDDSHDRALAILRSILDDDEACEALGVALVDRLDQAAQLLDPDIDDDQLPAGDDEGAGTVDPTRPAPEPVSASS